MGQDVAKAQGYTNTLKAIRDHVDSEDKGVNEMITPGQEKKTSRASACHEKNTRG